MGGPVCVETLNVIGEDRAICVEMPLGRRVDARCRAVGTNADGSDVAVVAAVASVVAPSCAIAAAVVVGSILIVLALFVRKAAARVEAGPNGKPPVGKSLVAMLPAVANEVELLDVFSEEDDDDDALPVELADEASCVIELLMCPSSEMVVL